MNESSYLSRRLLQKVRVKSRSFLDLLPVIFARFLVSAQDTPRAGLFDSLHALDYFLLGERATKPLCSN